MTATPASATLSGLLGANAWGRMGRSNVDVVRAFLKAFDEDRIDDLLAIVDPSVVFEPVLRPARSVYFGHDGVRVLHKDLRSSPGGGRGRYAEFIELPDGRVQVHGHMVRADGGVGAKSSPMFSVRNGLVVHAQGWSAVDELRR